MEQITIAYLRKIIKTLILDLGGNGYIDFDGNVDQLGYLNSYKSGSANPMGNNAFATNNSFIVFGSDSSALSYSREGSF